MLWQRKLYEEWAACDWNHSAGYDHFGRMYAGFRSIWFQSYSHRAGSAGSSKSRFRNFEASVVWARIPRTVFGVLAGAALGVSGALMQAVTRNPIADPSVLGVNTGASLFVVIGIAWMHITSSQQYIWLAFAGAALTAVFVYGIASVGYGGPTSIKLALAGTATGTALSALVNTIMLPDSSVMKEFRFWQVGSISGTSWGEIRTILAISFWWVLY